MTTESNESKWANRPAGQDNLTLPLWISAQQADRLAVQLEIEGFTEVRFSKGPHGGSLIVTANDKGPELNVTISEPIGLEMVVGRFLKWREQRNG